MGFDDEEVRFSIISNDFWHANTSHGIAVPTIHNNVRIDIHGLEWINGDVYHANKQSKYPVRMSLGINHVFVESNLVEPVVFVNGKYRPVLACVDIDFTSDNYQTYTPQGQEQIVQKMRTTDLSRVSFKLVDAFGDNLKLVGMSEDNVKIVVSLKRVA